MKDLILDEVFMHDEPESKSRAIYFDGTTFEAVDDNGHIRRFVYSKPLDELTDDEFKRVLDYNRSEDPFNEVFPDEVFIHGEFINEVFQVKDLESGEISLWSIEALLDEVNRDRSGKWTDYDSSDWREGWNEWVEGEFYSLMDEKVN